MSAEGRRSRQRASHTLERAAALLRSRKRIWYTKRMPELPAWCDAIDAVLVMTHDRLTVDRQAELLGVSRSVIRDWRSRLYRAGVLRKEDRLGVRPLRAEEIEHAATLARAGRSWQEISVLLGVSRARARRLVHRAGIRGTRIGNGSQRDHLPETWTTTRFGRTFGFTQRYIAGLVRRGLLPDHRIVQCAGAGYVWTYDDVLAFVRDRRTWMLWTPQQISDPQMRRIADDARRSVDGAWLSTKELAAMLHLERTTLARWIREDELWARYEWVDRHTRAAVVWLPTMVQGEIAALRVDPAQRGGGRNARRYRDALATVRRRLAARWGAQANGGRDEQAA